MSHDTRCQRNTSNACNISGPRAPWNQTCRDMYEFRVLAHKNCRTRHMPTRCKTVGLLKVPSRTDRACRRKTDCPWWRQYSFCVKGVAATVSLVFGVGKHPDAVCPDCTCLAGRDVQRVVLSSCENHDEITSCAAAGNYSTSQLHELPQRRRTPSSARCGSSLQRMRGVATWSCNHS